MKKGQAIVEVIIAFMVATIAVLGLVQVATRSVANAGAAKRAAQATAYAMEGMEWVTGQKYTVAWSDFWDKIGDWCLNDVGATVTWLSLAGGTCGSGVISGTEYSRYMTLVQVSPDEAEVTVAVKWQEGARTVIESQTSKFTTY